MRAAEQGFLLLTSQLGDPCRRPLTTGQLRTLEKRVRASSCLDPEREMTLADLTALGYGADMAQRILSLLSGTGLLQSYLRGGAREGCFPLSRVTPEYPRKLLEKLGPESPGCLWYKGNVKLLEMPMIALVGSRDIAPQNRSFAWEAGVQTAKQGYVLVSGNARGADRIAQTACLENGGRVICVVADSLLEKKPDERILYVSEDGFELPFTAKRAISRNRVIHCLGSKTLVVQSGCGFGGTWDGTIKNLKGGWSPVFCMDDGSEASRQLQNMGAVPVSSKDLLDFQQMLPDYRSLFDQ